MHSSPLPTPFLTGQTSTYRWLPMEPGSLRKLLTFLTKRPTEAFDFSARSPSIVTQLKCMPTPAQYFMH